MKKVIIGLALVCVVALSGCNTVAGAGRDVKSAGQGIENAANDAKNPQ